MMKKATALLTAATMGLALSACDSTAENEVEQQAEAIDEAAEADAEMMRAFGESAPDEEAIDAEADIVEEEGEETKDHLEDMADEMDDTPQ